MFGFFNSSGSEEQDEENLTLPFQVTDLLIERKVEQANRLISDLNQQYDWQVYLLPEDPTLHQLRELDDDLRRLYQKVSDNRFEDASERRMIIDVRQKVQEILEFYITFDEISKPVDISSTDSDDKNGGVTNVSA